MNTKTASVEASMRSDIICIVVFFTALLFYLLFSHLLPITDPVESNYVLTAKEMVLTSDWVSPRIYGNVWFDKPVFFYWLTAISFTLFGFSDVAARLAPAIFAALGVLLMYWFMTKIAKPSVALSAILVMGTSFEYIVLAKLVITDMVFFLFNSTALICFYLGYCKQGDTKRWYYFMYVSLAFAVLTKGPVGVLLPGLVMVIFIGVQRNWAEFKEMSILGGVSLFSLITLPWYIAMYDMHGSEFINTFLGVHNYLRATVSEHPKDNVSYYYIVVFLLSMFPWSLLTVKAMLEAYKERRQNSSPVVTFSFIWALVYFGFYSLMATKYLTYTFPILFPVSIITAFYLEKLLEQGETRSILSWVGIPLALVNISYIILSFPFLQDVLLTVTVSSLLTIVLSTCWQIRNRDAKRVFAMLCLCQIASCILLSLLVFPAVTLSKSGKDIADIIADKGAYRVGMYQFYSTSAVYYSGNIAVKLQPSSEVVSNQAGAIDWSAKYTMPSQTLAEFVSQSRGENALIVVPDKERDEFLEETQHSALKLFRHSKGFSYYYVND